MALIGVGSIRRSSRTETNFGDAQAIELRDLNDVGRDLNAVADLRSLTKGKENKATDRATVIHLKIKAEVIANIRQVCKPIDPPASIRFNVNVLARYLKLIRNIANHSLHDVIQRDHSGRATILIDRNNHVRSVQLHLVQQ